MSGRKYSKIEFQNAVKKAIHLKVEIEDALCQARNFVNALGESVKNCDSLKDLYNESLVTLIDIETKISESEFDESRLMQLTLDAVENRSKLIVELKKRLQDIIQRCEKGNEAIINRTEIIGILNNLKQNKDKFGPWLYQYENFIRDIETLLIKIDDHIGKTGGVNDITKEIENHKNLNNRYLNDISVNRKQAAERQYLLESLVKICQKKAFSLEIQPLKNPIDDIIINVDTFAYGKMRFVLKLNGTMHSLSEMINNDCSQNISDIQNELEQVGIRAEFKYEHNQEPVCIEKGKKSWSGTNDSGNQKGLNQKA